MTHDFVFPEVDETVCVAILQRLIQVNSVTKTSGEIDASNYMVKLCEEAGIESAIHKFDNGLRQNTVGIWKGTGGGKTLLFNGHLDTNPVGERWTVDPWGGIVKDGMVYGIGVSNMSTSHDFDALTAADRDQESGCCAYLCAVMALKRAGWQPRGDLVLTWVVGELQGGVGTYNLIKQGLCKADYFINCEPSDLKAITMHAESHVFRIELTGVTRHLSKREEATDSIVAMNELVPRLNKLVFPNARNDEVAACNRCHVGVVRAGLGQAMADSRPPQVADFAILRGSARTGPGQSGDDVEDALISECKVIQSRYPELDYQVVREFVQTMPAFEVSKEAHIVKRLNDAYQKVRPGQEQPTGALNPQCLYGSDAGHLFTRLGMEGVVCGPGGKYNTMPDERVEIVDYIDCIRIFMRVIVDVCG